MLEQSHTPLGNEGNIHNKITQHGVPEEAENYHLVDLVSVSVSTPRKSALFLK